MVLFFFNFLYFSSDALKDPDGMDVYQDPRWMTWSSLSFARGL